MEGIILLETFARLLVWLVISAMPLVVRAEVVAPSSTRAAFLKLIDRPRVDLSPQIKQQAVGDLTQIQFNYASEASQRVPGILLKIPGEARRPVVIVMHGTGGKKEAEIRLLKRFADKGFVAVAIDARYHGERGTQADYNAAIAHTFEKGGEHPLYWDTVWDVLRLIDYLQTRDDVEANKIGLMGISKGGIETYFAAAVDERIAVAVPCIGVQSFRWALEHDAWQGRVGTIRKGFEASMKSAGVERPDTDFVRQFYDRVVPGINSRFDGPVMMTLICPRPLLMINGDSDDKTPLEGVKLCGNAVRSAYDGAGVGEKFRQIVQPNTGHAVTVESEGEAVAWFVKWLVP